MDLFVERHLKTQKIWRFLSKKLIEELPEYLQRKLKDIPLS